MKRVLSSARDVGSRWRPTAVGTRDGLSCGGARWFGSEERVETDAPRPPTSIRHDASRTKAGTRNPLRRHGGFICLSPGGADGARPLLNKRYIRPNETRTHRP